jgi:hypothetical protein
VILYSAKSSICSNERSRRVEFFPGYTQEVENLRFRYRDPQAERALQKEQTQSWNPSQQEPTDRAVKALAIWANLFKSRPKSRKPRISKSKRKTQKTRSVKSSASASSSGNATGNDSPPWRCGKTRANEDIPPQISGAQANDLGQTPVAVKTENALASHRPRNHRTEVPRFQEAA